MQQPSTIINVLPSGTLESVNPATTRLPPDRQVIVLWNDGTWTWRALQDLR